MKTILSLCILFLLGASTTFAQWKQEHALAMGKEVDIDLQTGGRLTIVGWDKEQLLVEADLGGRDGRESDIRITETGRGLALESDYRSSRRSHSGNNRFSIHVPRRCSLD